MKITCEELEQAICEGLEFMIDEGELSNEKFQIQSFSDAGVLTNDAGLVLKIGNQEFQITIIRSK